MTVQHSFKKPMEVRNNWHPSDVSFKFYTGYGEEL